MKKYIFILIVIVFWSCNDSKKANIESQKVVKKELRPFFDSDKIDHYYLDFSEKDFFTLIAKDNNTKKEKEFLTIFEFNFPDTIPQKNFEKILLNHNYKRFNLSAKQQKEIENVFSEKDSLQMSAYACVAEYRDVFIFKKKEETVGIAKICFKCGRFQIIGSKLDTSGFGLWTELDRLKNIVRPNSKT
ncbi:hypothetical protein [Flavobacterium bizetiae]|uniref:hypothetical protein n=1 Tax=Flavobacterium bizetiae TaxID=2704140 RepID=UPI003757B68D